MNIEEHPTWKAGIAKPDYPKLSDNTSTDTVIVGGGLAGLFAAYELAKAGQKVVVLEKKKIGSGATEYTTAFLTQVVDTSLDELIKLFGEEKAKLIWQSHAQAIDRIETIARDEKIDCEFTRCSAYIYANDSKEFETIGEMSSTAQRLTVPVSNPRQDGRLNFANTGYFEVPNQAKFHPLKFLLGLAERITALGGQIYQDSEVADIKHAEDEVVVKTEANEVRAKNVVIATYQPFHNRIRMFLKRGMYKSYVLEARLPKRLLREGLYFDVANPYHYFRIDSNEDSDRMILGGADTKSIFKIDPEKSFADLNEYLNKILGPGHFEISRKWVGPILEPSDGIALIGQTREHEYIASAFSGNGMTYSGIAASIISDKILGRNNIYAEVYDPQRIPSLKQLFIKGSDYVEEFFGGAAKNVFRKKSESPT
ncbi:MAG: FAD-binding oxidoreductase [Candidatus Doudnabacteria bacterium]|nr:FAD-binding oxidoreductase [Candidatus Doudnabacteria bacterium]